MTRTTSHENLKMSQTNQTTLKTMPASPACSAASSTRCLRSCWDDATLDGRNRIANLNPSPTNQASPAVNFGARLKANSIRYHPSCWGGAAPGDLNHRWTLSLRMK